MSDDLTVAMSACHSLTSTRKNGVVGNPVDIAMFHASGAKLVNGSGPHTVVELPGGKHIEILRRFEFDHIRMTQSVIVQMPDGRLKAIVKGSGDKLCNLCEVPETFNQTLERSSSHGYYQIAVAWKDVSSMEDAIHLSRDDIEKDLMFVGILNFENCLRPKAIQVIDRLKSSGVDSVMLTGDSLLTGVHIAKESTIIPHSGFLVIGRVNKSGYVVWLDEVGEHVVDPLNVDIGKGPVQIALTGEAWQALLNRDREYVRRLSEFIRIVARCSPQDKVSVVDTFVGLGFTTMMCGDGGNDSGALKAAHVGIALSDSDASLVAPFTSLDKNIESVLTVLQEGRGALASTIALYKYLILYGNISSYVQVITYSLKTSFSDWMWVFVDGVWTVCFSLTLPLARAASSLSPTRPSASLLGWQTISSIVGIISLNYIFMAVALFLLYREDWFQCRKWEADIQAGNVFLASDNYETQVVFLLTGYQLLSAAVTFNVGYEFRQAWWRNYSFVVLAAGSIFIHVYITLVPGRMSCLWRVNCVDDYVIRGVVTPDPFPISNPFHSTVGLWYSCGQTSLLTLFPTKTQVMPVSFRWKLVFVAFCNSLCIVLYDYCFVNVLRRWWCTSRNRS
jgi:magnesium-transporting ATPase (P-type)